MSAELTKSIEEMTDEEKEALAERVSTMEFWDESDRASEAGRALRQRVVERPDLRTFAREDVVAVLNFAEAIRVSTHVVISLATDNLKRMHRALTSGKCAYCDWVYRDALLDVRADDPIPDEEIAAMHERVTAEIRQHVKTCLAHPMRQLERVTEMFEEALRFYAAADHWQSRSTGFEAQYDPALPAAMVDGGSLARLALTGRAQPAVDIERRLAELAALPANWDSYGALPIDRNAIAGARRIIRALAYPPQIVPTVNSGVQLEWHREGIDVEFEVSEDGRFTNLYVEQGGEPK